MPAGARSIAPPVGMVALATSPSPSDRKWRCHRQATELKRTNIQNATYCCSATANAPASPGARNLFRSGARVCGTQQRPLFKTASRCLAHPARHPKLWDVTNSFRFSGRTKRCAPIANARPGFPGFRSADGPRPQHRDRHEDLAPLSALSPIFPPLSPAHPSAQLRVLGASAFFPATLFNCIVPAKPE